jgi:ribosomal protein S18 acetylase RimI-like enzyme/glutaredoxin
MDVQLITRQGCHLCEEALALLRELGVEPRRRDVDADAQLFALYDFRVPVVLVDGRVVGEGRLDRRALGRALGAEDVPSLRVAPCGVEEAETVHRLTQAAFRGFARLDPPSGAGRETLDSVRSDLAADGAALGLLDGRPAGCLRFQVGADHVHVRRVAVLPPLQGRGIGRALMAWAESEAARRGAAEVTVGVRVAVPGNLAFYRRLGYEVVAEHAHPGYDRPTWLSMRKRLG